LQVLRRNADRRIGIKDILFADLDRPFNVDVRHQARARSDDDVRSQDAIGTDLRRVVDLCLGINDGGRVDRHQAGLSASLHITSASATTLPSTVAAPYIFATVALRLVTFISIRS